MPFGNDDSGADQPTIGDAGFFDSGNYMAGLDNGSMQYQDMNFGDLGYGGDPNNYNGSNGLNDLFLKNLGWKGGNPYNDTYAGNAGGNDNGPQQGPGYTPEFKQFMGDKGLSFRTSNAGPSSVSLQAYNPSGQTVGTPYQRYNEFPSEFNLAAMTALSAAGAAGGAGLAGSAGYGAGTAVGGASAGAGSGLASGLAGSGGDIGAGLKGAATGGLTGGLTSGLNPAGMTGVTDPMYSRAINGAVGAGARSAITGGNVGSSVLGSLVGSGASAAGQYGMGVLNNMDSDPYANEGVRLGNYPAPQAEGGIGDLFNHNYSTEAGSSPYPMADSITGGSQGQYSPDTTGGVMPSGLNQQQTENPIKKMLMAGLNGATGGGAPSRVDNMSANLMDLYSRYKNNQRQGGLASDLRSMYAPDSPYAQRLGIALTRADARSGRRTQIGPRQVELQARLAEQNSRNAPILNQIYGQQGQNRMGMGSDIFRMLSNNPNGGGAFDMLRNGATSLNNYFNTPQPTAMQNNDYAPGD